MAFADLEFIALHKVEDIKSKKENTELKVVVYHNKNKHKYTIVVDVITDSKIERIYEKDFDEEEFLEHKEDFNSIIERLEEATVFFYDENNINVEYDSENDAYIKVDDEEKYITYSTKNNYTTLIIESYTFVFDFSI